MIRAFEQAQSRKHDAWEALLQVAQSLPSQQRYELEGALDAYHETSEAHEQMAQDIEARARQGCSDPARLNAEVWLLSKLLYEPHADELLGCLIHNVAPSYQALRWLRAQEDAAAIVAVFERAQKGRAA